VTAVAVMAEAQCLEALEDLARNWSETGGSVREVALSALVHPSWAGFALAEKWADFMEAVLTEEDLLRGMSDWRNYPSWEDARNALRGQAAAAMSQLVNGVGVAPGQPVGTVPGRSR
jgi:hypothetical protein